jgi:hypothetical protein
VNAKTAGPKHGAGPGKYRARGGKKTAEGAGADQKAVSEFLIMKRDGFEVNPFLPSVRFAPKGGAAAGAQGFSIAAWAAARMAVGTRKGEQLT